MTGVGVAVAPAARQIRGGYSHSSSTVATLLTTGWRHNPQSEASGHTVGADLWEQRQASGIRLEQRWVANTGSATVALMQLHRKRSAGRDREQREPDSSRISL